MRAKQKVTSVRLPLELATDLEIIARVKGQPVSVLFREAAAKIVAEHKSDADFRALLKEHQEAERAAFKRLSG